MNLARPYVRALPNSPPDMSAPRTIEFDGWTLRLDSGELERAGQRVRLQDQPFQVLHELLCRPGELVTREQLIARLWPKGVVDFDLGLNSAVRKLRVALQDEADTPRYIQTVPRKGYRFIGAVERPTWAPPESVPHGAPAPQPSRDLTYLYLAVAIVTIAIFIGGFSLRRSDGPPAAPGSASQSASLAIEAATVAVVAYDDTIADTSRPAAAAGIAAALRDALARIAGLAVLADGSAATVRTRGVDTAHTRYVVRARVESPAADRAQVQLELLDRADDRVRWSEQFIVDAHDVASMSDAAARGVANALNIEYRPAASTGNAVALDAYEVYARAEKLLTTERPDGADEAALLLLRVTEMAPQFARAYAALGEAYLAGDDFRGRERSAATRERAHRALDRALALNPRQGEAWIHRARLATDPAAADEDYRRGIAFAPGYDVGYAGYAGFLAAQRRRGEAIEVISRARRLDPYSMTLLQSDAVMQILSRSDLAAHDAVLREALAIDPNHGPLLSQLAQSTYLWTAELAESARLAEAARASSGDRKALRTMLVSIYLDLDDPSAAAAVVSNAPPAEALVEIAQYRRDSVAAARLAEHAQIVPFHAVAPVAEAVRDAALETGDYGPALQRLKTTYKNWRGAAITIRSVAIVYAHTLVLAGQARQGRDLARTLLTQVDAEAEGRPHYWFARERATLYAILGDDERALDELEVSVAGNHMDRWWYTAELDPLFERVRRLPRFAALDAQVRRHRESQRAALERMRRAGALLSKAGG